VNTIFDLAAGRVQYVDVLPDVVPRWSACARADRNTTGVAVTYERTALREAAPT